MPEDETRLLYQDLATLSACVSLDQVSDRRRTLPTIPPVVLWRILPRLLRRVAKLGGEHIPAVTARFMLAQADAIEAGPSAVPTIAAENRKAGAQ